MILPTDLISVETLVVQAAVVLAAVLVVVLAVVLAVAALLRYLARVLHRRVALDMLPESLISTELPSGGSLLIGDFPMKCASQGSYSMELGFPVPE